MEVLKLCDFGSTNYMNMSFRPTANVGTLEYFTPEMLKGEGHNESLDCWCLGVLTYELLTGMNPFAPKTYSHDREEIIRRNIAKANPRFPRDFPALGKDFVRKIITKKMTRRLTIK